MKGLLKNSPDQVLGVHEKLLAGSTAGVIAQTAIYPLEVLLHPLVTPLYCSTHP